MISLYYVYEEGGSPEGVWVMWIHYYTYFVTEETCSTVAHIHTPLPRHLASADKSTKPDNDISVSLEAFSLEGVRMRDGNHGKSCYFNIEIERSR
jgi:hypothetical protein